MRKLLSANISRLWKEKLFWLVLGFMAIGSAGFSWLTYETAMKNTDMQFYVEDLIFNMLPMLGSVFVIFIGMHLGTEFDEHTIRNKLIVGYNRTQVYFAEYITCLAASLILLAVMLLAGCFTVNARAEETVYPKVTHSYITTEDFASADWSVDQRGAYLMDGTTSIARASTNYINISDYVIMYLVLNLIYVAEDIFLD